MIVVPLLVARLILFDIVSWCVPISRVNAAHFYIRVMGGFAYFGARKCIGSFPCTTAAIEASASALTCTLPWIIRARCAGIYLSSAADSK